MNDSAEIIAACPAFNITDDGFTNFEYLFYIGCGITGTALNVLTLFVTIASTNTYDKPRQVDHFSYLQTTVLHYKLFFFYSFAFVVTLYSIDK